MLLAGPASIHSWTSDSRPATDIGVTANDTMGHCIDAQLHQEKPYAFALGQLGKSADVLMPMC